MKVLIVVDSQYPNPGAGSKRISNYVKALSLEKNEVKIMPIIIRSQFKHLPLFLSPIIPIMAFWKVLVNSGKEEVIYIYGFGWVGQLMIILASKIRGKAVGIEVCEKPYSILGSRRDILLKYIYPFHHFLLRNIVFKLIDGFIVISEALSDYVIGLKKKKAIILKIPILVDFAHYQKSIKEPRCDKPFLLHTATVNDHKDGMLNVFKAFARLVTEDKLSLHFYLTSNTMLPIIRDEIESIIESKKIGHYVHFVGDLDEDTLLGYQKTCALVVINKIDSEQNRYNFSTKIGEYLALGKPIITTRIGEVNNYLVDRESCLYIEPGNIDQIVTSIRTLLVDIKLREKISANGQVVAKDKFDYVINSKRISHFFDDLLHLVPGEDL